MGWWFRKSVKVGGLRLNLNKRSLSVTQRAGPVTRSAGTSGRRTTSVRLGGGFRWMRRK